MRTRILEGDDLQALVNSQGPFHMRHDVVAQLGNAQVVVVEADNGAIIAHWPIWVAVHLEPLWIDPEQQRNPAVVRSLVEAMRAQLQLHGITSAFAVIGHADLVTHLPMAARLGFQRVPGDLFILGGAHDGSSSGTGDQSGGAVLRQPGREQAGAGGDQRRDDGPPDLRR